MVARFAVPIVLSRRRLTVPESSPTPGGEGILDILRVTGQSLKWLRPGDTCYGEFQVRNPTSGILTTPGTGPTIEIVKNNVVDVSVSVTITAPSTGRYRYQFTVPVNYVPGDFVAAIASATVEGLTDVATLVDTRLVAMDWTNVAAGSETEVTSISSQALLSMRDGLAGVVVVQRGPVFDRGGNVTMQVTAGDDYSADDARPIDIDLDGDSLPDLATANVWLRMASGQKLLVSGSAVVATGSIRTVRFQPTAAETALLTPGVSGLFAVKIVTAEGRTITPAEGRGTLIVLPKVAP